MTDFHEMLRSSQSLNDIDINTPGLPTTNGMLIWYGLAFTESQLKNYIIDAPKSEKKTLNKIKNLIEESQTSTRKALSCYPKLFKCIEDWYQITNIENIDYEKSIILLKSIDYVLKSLAHDCKNISWTLRHWIPKKIYIKINQLLNLGKDKFRLLNAAQISYKDKLNQPPKELPTFDKMKRTLDQGLLSLINKTSAVAENKNSYQYLLNQFKQLNLCFSNNDNSTMDIFWSHYSDKKLFKELMDLLLLTSSEQTSWLRSYEFYRLNEPTTKTMLQTIGQTFSSLYNITNYKLLGAKLSTTLLKKRVEQATELLYNQVVDKSLQQENKRDWLKQIELTLENSTENPLLNKLLIIQQTFKDKIPKHSFKVNNYDSKLKALSNKADFTTQTRLKDVSTVRKQLALLLNKLIKLDLRIKEKRLELQEFINNINLLRQVTTSTSFQLTDINCNELLRFTAEILAQLKQNTIEQLPEQMLNVAPDDNIIEIYQKCNYEIVNQINKVKNITNNFNDKGHQLRHCSLQELEKLINQQHGFIDSLFRLLSSNYNKCMVEIESLLRSNQSSLEKINNIIFQLSNAQNNSFYFVNQRLKKLSSSNRYGMFENNLKDNIDDDLTNINLITTIN